MVVLMALSRSRRAAAAALCLGLLWARSETAAAQSPASSDDAAGAVVVPEPVGPISIPYPANAPPQSGLVVVKVLLTIGVSGAVSAVQVDEGAGEPFDSAVIEGAKHFQFRPATLNGAPVEVVLPFTQTFVPPAAAAQAGGPKLEAVLEGLVVERGTRRPVGSAAVAVKDSQGERAAETDGQGHFSVGVAAGQVQVRVVSQGLRRFLRLETLKPDEKLRVKYLVDRESYDPYESIVVGSREREEMSRTTLSGREIHQLPGTFGDPFRVVSVLPGVTQVMSLLPLPVVRGSSPGDTGIFLDGVRLPLLFHLFGGPSVVHPEMIERVDFYPGGFPVSYGGYTGGIIDGQTARPRAGDRRLDFDLNLTQAGAFAREPIPGTSMTATLAGRYGYPGMVLSAITNQLSLSYWDYQARLDGGSAQNAWSVFFLGARDQVKTASGPPPAPGAAPSLQTQALFLFHRVDMRYRLGGEERNGNYRLVLGYDESQIASDQAGTHSWFLDPQLSWLLPLGSSLRLHAGAELLVRDIGNPPAAASTGPATQAAGIVQESGVLVTGGAYVEAPWKPVEGVLVVPGVRSDVYRHAGTTQLSVDPRLTLRWKPLEARELWLKGVVGRYHQPPRLFLPLPGVDQSSLKLGLLASTQVGAGAEAGLAPGIDLDLQGYYNDMNPVVFDLQVNPSLAEVQPTGPSSQPGQLPTGDQPSGQSDVTSLFTKRLGRSYGLEMLLRKRDTHGVYGWLAYTLSHSERKGDAGWAPFDFDRTHIFNAVAGVRLPRNWELGGRLLLQSGTPVTTIHGYNAGRTNWQFRADLRVDKRAVWNSWLLDFYVDIVNVMVSEDSGGLLGSTPLRYVLPTVGFRAVL